MSQTTHPEHPIQQEVAPGVWMPAPPIRDSSWWHQWRRERRCRQAGGHWWHPADAMIRWFCCRCGADRDGMPKDGPAGGLL
jgi:hypothetical protein